MLDQRSDIVVANGLTSATISSETTTNGASITTAGYKSITFAMKVESYTDGKFTLALEDSPNGSTWTAVNSAFVIGTATQLSAVGVDTLGYVGTQPYVRMTIVSVNGGGSAVNSVLSGTAIKGNARHNPATA